MPTNDHAATYHASHRARAALSRIAMPFSTRPRHLSDFAINLDEPHRTFAPGDIVRGHIQLTVPKLVRITHIVLSLIGYVKVYKNPIILGDGPPPNASMPATGKGARGVEFLGNGRALIFEEEVIVCGDGRLNPGRYSFEFQIRFPSTGLPSSLDFERGSIAYALVASVTRPTTIAPIITCDRRLHLVESIDIASLPPPKPRAISLAPIGHRNRSRNLSRDLSDPATSISSSRRPSLPERPPSAGEPPRTTSPESNVQQSDVVPASPTSSSPSYRQTELPLSGRSNSQLSVQTLSRKTKVITAQISLLRRGYLPLDTIPVKIAVQHTRFVKSFPGVIVTLYRKGRLDRHPILPTESSKLDDAGQSKQMAFSDLSLMSTESSHTFRMDLAQASAPLVVNPNTLQAEIKTAIHVPEDAFPSITSVPGGMISFTYHLEVLMDLNGRLDARDAVSSRVNMTSSSNSIRLGELSSIMMQGNSSNMGLPLIDTSRIRRKRSIAMVLFDVTIGSRDSQRKASKKPLNAWDETEEQMRVETDDASSADALSQPQYSHADSRSTDHQRSQPDPPAMHPVDAPYEPDLAEEDDEWAYIPPPPESEESVDEKTRLRQREQALLPSAPPEDGPSSSSAAAPIVSVPTAQDLEAALHPDVPPTALRETFPPSAIAGSSSHLGWQNTPDVTSTPSPPPAIEPTAATLAPTEDKQELERRRLQALASSPAYEEEGEQGPSTARPVATEAPVLDHHDEQVIMARERDLRRPSYADESTTEADHDDLPQYAK